MTTSPRCTIVPPYLLEALSRSGDPDLEARARATLAHDGVVRAARRGSPSFRQDTGGLGMPPGPAPAVQASPGQGGATGPKRTIFDCHGAQDLPGTQVRSEGGPATADEAVSQAYDGLGDTWELFAQVFGRDSLDGKGLPLLASVHYGRNYDNAFWNGSQMVFGDGDGEIFLPFTRSIDVIGHELTHGVTEYTSGLNYTGQSGALNESISDVFGALVKQKTLGQSAQEADWLIGADLLAPGVSGVTLRSMKEPGSAYDDPRLGKDPQPGHLRDYVHTSADNGGVHINSGIPNRAFYLVAIALGGNAWETAGGIWYAAITGDIKADCDFATFATLTEDAAVAAYGAGSPQAVAVRQAWLDVGVEGVDRPGVRDAGADGSARSTPERPAPAPKSPSPQTEVSLRRTGGFAGLERQRTVTLDELPPRDVEQWQTLLAEPAGLHGLARQASMHPDAFCYGISCADPQVDVTLPEPALGEDLRSLFDRTLEG